MTDRLIILHERIEGLKAENRILRKLLSRWLEFAAEEIDNKWLTHERLKKELSPDLAPNEYQESIRSLCQSLAL